MKPSKINHLQKSLTQCRLFKGLSNSELRQVLLVSRQKALEPDSFLFHQGEHAQTFYIVTAGKIKLTQITPEGHQVIIRYVGTGGAIGILAALGDFPYPVSGESVDACQLLAWQEVDISRLMERVPRLAVNGMKMLAHRFADMMDRYRELATERVERRIARALLRLTKQSGRKTGAGILIDLPLTRRDLAEMTGTTMYTVSRTLSGWEQKGFVKTGREQVTICSPHAMTMIAEDLPKEKLNA